jgi:hypothetical protein
LPLTIPPFVQYQSPIVPLRGLWNTSPKEGDMMISAEIDWLVSPPGNAVQFSLSGNSPVAISQIVALGVDNSRSGADVQFVFSDSGSQLVVPAHNQLVAPVFTNGLMFYAIAGAAVLGDVTAFLVFNSMPPPVPIAPSIAQNHAAITGVPLSNGTTPVIPPPTTGTLNTISMIISPTGGASPGVIVVSLVDGTGRAVWSSAIELPAGETQTIPIDVSGLSLRFVNGLNLVLSGASNISGWMFGNLYFSTP